MLGGELPQPVAHPGRRDDLLDHQPRDGVVVADQRPLGPLAREDARAVDEGGQGLLAGLVVVPAPQVLDRRRLALDDPRPVRGVPREPALPEGGRAAVPEQRHEVGGLGLLRRARSRRPTRRRAWAAAT